MKKILLDMDGVLVDFVAGSMRLHNQPDPYEDGSFSDFYIEKKWNFTAEMFWNGMDRQFWANLAWMPDGRDIFRVLHTLIGPERICLLTSPCSNDGCYDGKIDWIHKHLPKEYHRRFLVGPSKEFCACEDNILVDDHDGNVEKFVKHGGNAILIPRKWNKNRLITDGAASYLLKQLEQWTS